MMFPGLWRTCGDEFDRASAEEARGARWPFEARGNRPFSGNILRASRLPVSAMRRFSVHLDLSGNTRLFSWRERAGDFWSRVFEGIWERAFRIPKSLGIPSSLGSTVVERA
jgi:hypothetical protein